MEKIFNVVEIITPIGNGITKPFDCFLENNLRAVIKVYNNPETNIVLVNEWVCYQLAKIVQLPITQCGICIVDEKTKDPSNYIDESNHGYGFYSIRLDNSTIMSGSKMFKMVSNKNEIPKLILFDHLVYNKDRNKGNLVFSFFNKELFMNVIDHSHVFNLETLWDSTQLKKCIERNDYLDYEILTGNRYLYDIFFQNMSIDKEQLIAAADDINAKITSRVIKEALSKVPIEWNVSEQDLLALDEYLNYRLKHLVDYIDLIINYKTP